MQLPGHGLSNREVRLPVSVSLSKGTSKWQSRSKSRAQTEAPAQLSLLNFDDDIESLETEAVVSEPEKPPVIPAVDSEEQVLATVQSFDSAFAGDPLAAKYLAFGMAVKAQRRYRR